MDPQTGDLNNSIFSFALPSDELQNLDLELSYQGARQNINVNPI